jgi:beta-glucosidase
MYAPGVNIHRTPFGGRAHEYFSEDPYLSGIAAEWEIESIQSYGVIVYVKHYAFNDQECNRNGIGIWLNEQAAREIYLKPFMYACSSDKGNAHAVMSSFNRAGCGWTSANKGLITNILRDEFGFDGFVLTDMADSNGTAYMSCLDGMMAGTDAWLSSGKNHTFTSYKSNAAVCNAMREAAHRILYTMCNYSATMNGYSNNTRMVRVYTWIEITLITLVTVFSVCTACAIAMYCISKVKDSKTEQSKQPNNKKSTK